MSPDWTGVALADQAFIRQRAASAEIRTDLVKFDAEGRLLFTVKGLRYYRAACAHYQVTFHLESLRTRNALLSLHQALLYARSAQVAEAVRAELSAGSVSPQWRELAQELVGGDLSSVAAAIIKTRQCLEAGPSVVPVAFQRKGHAAA